MTWCQICMFIHGPEEPCGLQPAGRGLKNIEHGVVTSRRQQVQVRLDEEIIQAIHKHPRYHESERGREGGVPRWIRELVYEALGLPPPPDLHDLQSAERKGQPRKPRA